MDDKFEERASRKRNGKENKVLGKT